MRRTLLILLAVGWMPAQTPKPAFEVVSIKVTQDDPMELAHAGINGMKVDDAQLVYRATPLWTVILSAFKLPADQVVMPSWALDVRFNIDGKLPAGSTKAQVPEMLQTMLADRLKMTFHHWESPGQSTKPPNYRSTERRLRPAVYERSGKSLSEVVPGIPRTMFELHASTSAPPI